MKITKITLGLMLIFILGLGGTSFAQDEPVEEPSPEVNIRFLYVMCNDVQEMKWFYTDLCRMDEFSYYNEDDFQWLCYNCEGFQLMFFGAVDPPIPVIDEWTWQPGWGGDIDGISWSIEYEPEMFIEVVKDFWATKAEGHDLGDIPIQDSYPEWRQGSYFGFNVRDPMGNTVELYTVPEEDYTPEPVPEGDGTIPTEIRSPLLPWDRFLLWYAFETRF